MRRVRSHGCRTPRSFGDRPGLVGHRWTTGEAASLATPWRAGARRRARLYIIVAAGHSTASQTSRLLRLPAGVVTETPANQAFWRTAGQPNSPPRVSAVGPVSNPLP